MCGWYGTSGARKAPKKGLFLPACSREQRECVSAAVWLLGSRATVQSYS